MVVKINGELLSYPTFKDLKHEEEEEDAREKSFIQRTRSQSEREDVFDR